MKKINLVLVLGILICLLIRADVAESKAPNIGKKITYYSGYTRLSDAITAISELSEIKIFSGQNTSDWQVRDMPVVICANEIEVGKLLKIMAEIYYLAISETDIDGITSYRFYRPKSYVQQLDNYSKSFGNNEYAAYIWNSLKQIGSLNANDSEALFNKIVSNQPNYGDSYKSDAGGARLAFDEIVLYGRLVNSIDETGLSKLLNGEEVIFSVEQGGAIGKLVSDYIRVNQKCLKASRERVGSTADNYFNEFDFENAHIKFKLDENNGYDLRSEIVVRSNGYTGFYGDSFFPARTVAPGKAPKDPGNPSLEMENMKRIARSVELEPKENYSFNMPSKKQLLLADVLTEVSKVTGYTIVADDNYDHKDNPEIPEKDAFKDKKTMQEIRKLIGSSNVWYDFTNEKILGIKSISWAFKYINLVPKTNFTKWLRLSDSNGFGLVDYLSIRRLTDGQKIDWIYGIKQLDCLTIKTLSDTQTSLLNILSSVDEATLEYAILDRVPLTSFDTSRFTRFFNSLPEDLRPLENISKFSLRILRKDIPDTDKYTYDVEIFGSEQKLKFPLGVTFPLRNGE